MRKCEPCGGPGPCKWDDSTQVYACVNCHNEPDDDFFERAKDPKTIRLSHVEVRWSEDARYVFAICKIVVGGEIKMDVTSGIGALDGYDEVIGKVSSKLVAAGYAPPSDRVLGWTVETGGENRGSATKYVR